MTADTQYLLRRVALFAAISAIAYAIVFQPLWHFELVGAFYLGLPLFGFAQGVWARRMLGNSVDQRGITKKG